MVPSQIDLGSGCKAQQTEDGLAPPVVPPIGWQVPQRRPNALVLGVTQPGDGDVLLADW